MLHGCVRSLTQCPDGPDEAKALIPAETESKKSLSDHSIPAHITQLHRLSVRRFPESLTLWDAFIAHALSQSSPNLVSRTLSSAIAMHPTHTPYWIMASQWESEGDRKGMGGGNAEAARRLCMRALRFLKGKKGEKEGMEGPEEAIWREWIRVEVSFVEKLRGRWQVLGLGKGKGGKEIIRVKGANGEADEGDEEEEEIQLPTTEEGDDQDAQLAEEMTEQAKSGQEALLDGAIVRLVIDNLLKCESRSSSFANTLTDALFAQPTSTQSSLTTSSSRSSALSPPLSACRSSNTSTPPSPPTSPPPLSPTPPPCTSSQPENSTTSPSSRPNNPRSARRTRRKLRDLKTRGQSRSRGRCWWMRWGRRVRSIGGF